MPAPDSRAPSPQGPLNGRSGPAHKGGSLGNFTGGALGRPSFTFGNSASSWRNPGRGVETLEEPLT